MGKFVELNNKDIVRYEALTKNPFEKVFALESVLKFYKLQYYGQIHTSEVFYDTPNDILYKAGIILSKIQEEDRVFFKVAQMSQSKALSTKKVFAHQIGANDTLKDHSFYLVEGISGIFSTPFYVDLENVIKNAIPKAAAITVANVYKAISGTGFRAYVCMEDTKYENFETKRTQKGQGMTVKMIGPDQYLPEFNAFNDAIKKYCKDFVEVHKNLYEYIRTITRKIDAKQARLDAKKAKENIEVSRHNKIENEDDEE